MNKCWGVRRLKMAYTIFGDWRLKILEWIPIVSLDGLHSELCCMLWKTYISWQRESSLQFNNFALNSWRSLHSQLKSRKLQEMKWKIPKEGMLGIRVGFAMSIVTNEWPCSLPWCRMFVVRPQKHVRYSNMVWWVPKVVVKVGNSLARMRTAIARHKCLMVGWRVVVWYIWSHFNWCGVGDTIPTWWAWAFILLLG